MSHPLKFAAAAVLLASAPAAATPFAVEVIDYVPGALPDSAAGYTNPAAALGKTREKTPAAPAFGVPGYVITPFNATFTDDDLVAVGNGGRLVLRLDSPAPTTNLGLGVHTGVGLIDTDYPNGSVGAVATPYTSPRIADVRVSTDGETWFDIADNREFDIPTNWYAEGIETPGVAAEAGTVQADFAQPFAGTLSDFDGLDWNGILNLLDGSAGGEWLDLSGLPVADVQFVEFSVDQPGTTFLLDAVATVPEPATALSLAAVGGLLLRRRK